jgi:hypothetical protein
MHIPWLSLLLDIAPGLALVAAAAASAAPSYLIMRNSRRGRARSAIAFLSGYIAALTTTAVFAAAVASFHADSNSILAVGLIAAFIGPLCAMAVALWRRPVRRHDQLSASAQ